MGWRNFGYGYYGFRPYVSVARRRADAAREMQKQTKSGRKISPVIIEGRTIAASFWGKAWCKHLESYSDYANRLPRGRTYVRNGSVVDLQILPGKITAQVMGSELYEIGIKIDPLKKDRWEALKGRCSGKIKSVLELLKGGISAGVMEVMSHRDDGMFPAPTEIKKDCSCPDVAELCKHLAAVLYGVGARLDAQPELLFILRQVDPAELIAEAAAALGDAPASRAGALRDEELSDVFGIDLVNAADAVPAESTASATPAAPPAKRPAKPPARRPAKRSAKPALKRKVAAPGSQRVAAARKPAPAKRPPRQAATA